MNWKLKEATLKEVMITLANENIPIDDFYFYVEDVGYLQVNSFSVLENGTIQIGNYVVDIKNEYELNDRIFISPFLFTITL